MSKLTAAEVKLLKHLTMVVGETTPIEYLRPGFQRIAKRMRNRGLISKREYWKGWIKATALGKRSLGYHQ